jgi:hypothetical protein
MPAHKSDRLIEETSAWLMVACSYLKERGWCFEAAHQALLEAAPRKV